MKCTVCGYMWEGFDDICPSCGNPVGANRGEELYSRAVTAERERKYTTAIRCYAQAADSGVPCAAWAVCRCMEKTGERMASPDLYEFWLSTASENDSLAAFAYANYLKRAGEESEAVRMLAHASDLGSEDADLSLGWYFLRQGDRAGARFYYARAGRKWRAKVMLFFLGKKREMIEPKMPELPDNSVGQYAIGTYAEKLELPHIAFHYYESAARDAYLPALEKAADMCMRGLGTVRDEEKVETYLVAVGEGGKTDAFIRLGDYYTSGVLGGTPNPVAAYAMYLRAAEAGNARALLLVGDCLVDGNGVERDALLGMRYYERAVEAGMAEGVHRAAKLREDAEAKYCRANDAREAGENETAYRLFREAADLGNAEAMCAVGDCLLAGRGCARDTKAAIAAYRRAAAADSGRAHFRLGSLCLLNFGLRFSKTEAKAYFDRALALGYEAAREKLDNLRARNAKHLAGKLYTASCAAYHRGDHVTAARLRHAAAKLGHPRAIYLLGCMYDCGDGVTRDSARANILYDQALIRGYDGKATGMYGKYLRSLPR